MQCPACSTELSEEDVFCESCGTRLVAEAASPAVTAPGCVCGAGGDETDEDGFCLRCGLRARRAQPADRIEQVVSAGFAAVSDRGLKHDRNEDRVLIREVVGTCAMVVCDGVSASRQSEIASAAVTEGVLESLEKSIAEGSEFAAVAALRGAITDGAAKLRTISAVADDDNAPSTTVVAAVVRGGEMVVGWMGDSRAYWIDASGAHALTHDHSWMNEIVAAGGLSMEEAARAPQAHAITRWIGADAGEALEPEIVRLPILGPGLLLLCTDGLWNYVGSEEAMAKLVAETCAGTKDALELARGLVQFANDRGGQDNITVVILRAGEVGIDWIGSAEKAFEG